MSLTVLYEDNHLLAVVKPAGLATMGVRPGVPSLVGVAKQYLKDKYAKPGNVYLGVVSRLDVPVTGVIVLARTSKAAARLNRQFREGDVEKLYWAFVERVPDPPAGQCVDWLQRHPRNRRVQLVDQPTSISQEARLRYRTLNRSRAGALLEIQLETGRKHQIRVQLASRGWPIRGGLQIWIAEAISGRDCPARAKPLGAASGQQDAVAVHCSAAAQLDRGPPSGRMKKVSLKTTPPVGPET